MWSEQSNLKLKSNSEKLARVGKIETLKNKDKLMKIKLVKFSFSRLITIKQKDNNRNARAFSQQQRRQQKRVG